MPLYEKAKIRLLFNKSQNNNPEFKQEVIICRSQYDTFSDAITYLNTVVARLFLDALKSMSRRNINSVATK